MIPMVETLLGAIRLYICSAPGQASHVGGLAEEEFYITLSIFK